MESIIMCICLALSAMQILIVLNVCVVADDPPKPTEKTILPGSLRVEDMCVDAGQCESGFCCPSENLPLGVIGKTCRYLDCCQELGNSSTAEPAFTEFEYKELKYKLFIKQASTWLDGAQICCHWAKQGSLAIISTDDQYIYVENQIFQALHVEQLRNKHLSQLELTVFMDGTDIDAEGNYTNVFSGEPKGNPIDMKFFPSIPPESFDENCVGFRYYDPAYGTFKLSTFDCRRQQPFLCSAPINPTDDV